MAFAWVRQVDPFATRAAYACDMHMRACVRACMRAYMRACGGMRGDVLVDVVPLY